MMKKILLLVVITVLLMACGQSKEHTRIFTNLYEANSMSAQVDSLNQIFQEHHLPLAFSLMGSSVVLDIRDTYKVYNDTCEMTKSIDVVEDFTDCCLIGIGEYLCGYDIWLVYEKQYKLLYKSSAVNPQGEVYDIIYNSFDFTNHTFRIVYTECDSVVTVPFYKCPDRDIVL